MIEIPAALTIAGSDSGAGAGIQADLKTMSAIGCYAATAITALTAQNTLGVQDVFPVPSSFVRSQIEAVLSDINIRAVKTGMLYSSEIILEVVAALQKYKITNLVVDPVVLSTSGKALLKTEALDVFRSKLLPLTRLLTPNLPEMELFCGQSIQTVEDMKTIACRFGEKENLSVLLKGGHQENSNEITDVFYNVETKETLILPDRKIKSPNKHGTGCTLASACAAYLALGNSLTDSVQKARAYMTSAIEAAKDYEIGKGHAGVEHFFGIGNASKRI